MKTNAAAPSTRFASQLLLALAIYLALSARVPAQQPGPPSQFVIFDVSAAGSQPFQGTTPIYVNASGEVMGWIQDENNVFHGFVRDAQGGVTVFDVPGAGTGPFQGTFAPGLVPDGFDNHGDIAGEYFDANNTPHAFVRNKDGSIFTFDAPGQIAGTYAGGVNNNGPVVGATFAANFLNHAYVRTADGTFTLFDAPDAGTAGSAVQYQGTIATAVNSSGDVAGIYADANNQHHGFLRDAGGNLTEFQVPGAAGRDLAYAYSMNETGDIAGFYSDINGARHGYVRSKDGTITPFDAPGAGAALFQGTLAEVINNSGDVTGFYTDANYVTHGFVRNADGMFVTFDAPGAGTGAFQGTFPGGINEAGDVTGNTFDSNNLSHGFVMRKQN